MHSKYYVSSSDWGPFQESEDYSKDVFSLSASDLSNDLDNIDSDNRWWPTVLSFTNDLFNHSTTDSSKISSDSVDITSEEPLKHQMSAKSTSEKGSSSEMASVSASDQSSEPISYIVVKVENISVNSNESSAQSSGSVTQLEGKRRRGRPAINDPIVKAKNKKMSQIKAAKNYRRKQKWHSKEVEEEYKLLSIKNNALKCQLKVLLAQCQKMLQLCHNLPNLKPKDRKRLKKSHKAINSISDCE